MSITAENYMVHPIIVCWREAFKDFGVDSGYCSSVESLLKSNDTLHQNSVMSMTPMGGYDLSKIKGNIVICSFFMILPQAQGERVW